MAVMHRYVIRDEHEAALLCQTQQKQPVLTGAEISWCAAHRQGGSTAETGRASRYDARSEQGVSRIAQTITAVGKKFGSLCQIYVRRKQRLRLTTGRRYGGRVSKAHYGVRVSIKAGTQSLQRVRHQ